jgi:Flp pilus assembly protein TadG
MILVFSQQGSKTAEVEVCSKIPWQGSRKMKIFRNISGSKGVAAVEMALVLPVFFFVVFATADFGWYFYVKHTIQSATREGTRLGLVGTQLKDQNNNPMPRVQSIITTIQNLASLAVDKTKLSIYIYPVGSDYITPTGSFTNTSVNAGVGGDYMRVQVKYTYNFLTPFIGNFFAGGKSDIQANSLYRNELF